MRVLKIISPIRAAACAAALAAFAAPAAAEGPDMQWNYFASTEITFAECVSRAHAVCREIYGKCRNTDRGAIFIDTQDTLAIDCGELTERVIGFVVVATEDPERYDHIGQIVDRAFSSFSP